MRKPSSSKVSTRLVKKEMIALGRKLALCGQGNDPSKPLITSAEDTNMQIVCVDDCGSSLEYDLEYKKYLVSYKESFPQPYLLEGNTPPLRIMYNVDDDATDKGKGRAKRRSKSPPLSSSVSKKLKTKNVKEDHKLNSTRRGRKIAQTKNTVKLEPTRYVKDTQQKKRGRPPKNSFKACKFEKFENEESSGRMKLKPHKILRASKRMQAEKIVKDTYQKIEVARRGRPPKNSFKACKMENEESSGRIKVKPQRILRASKRMQAEKIVKDTLQKIEVARRGRPPKNSFKACKFENEESSVRIKVKPQKILRASKRMQAEKIVPVVDTKETKRKKEDARAKSNFKTYKKENEESSATRDERSQTISRASKRLKTENGRADNNLISKTRPVVQTKDTKRKKGQAPPEKKIPVTKDNVNSKSTSHVKDNLLNSFKANKKENEESRSLIDKSYEYFLAFLRNSITVFEPVQKVKPENDFVPLSDPDIIAVSDYPFADGGISPFAVNKDGKVIDLEEGIVLDDMFNSSYSKKLLDILRKPYDKNEFSQRRHEALHKRQVTRSRQLRDGREIEYDVDDQLRRSYLDQYPDFKRLFRRCRYGKDDPKALNLLRGFFFYLENIVHEGAFKPWHYEARLKRECGDIVCV